MYTIGMCACACELIENDEEFSDVGSTRMGINNFMMVYVVDLLCYALCYALCFELLSSGRVKQ